jgi:hypothetical protein
MNNCKSCPHFLASVSFTGTIAECGKAHKSIGQIYSLTQPIPTPKWCPMNEVHPTILAAIAPMIPPPTDTQRMDWVLEVLSGDESAEADRKTYAMAKALTLGLVGRAMLDKAMSL